MPVIQATAGVGTGVLKALGDEFEPVGSSLNPSSWAGSLVDTASRDLELVVVSAGPVFPLVKVPCKMIDLRPVPGEQSSVSGSRNRSDAPAR